jgi:hypothetical protein
VSSTEAFQRAVVLALLVEVSTTSAAASNPDLTMGDLCWKTDLEAAGARSQHLAVARIQLEVVAAMWTVVRLRDLLMRVPYHTLYTPHKKGLSVLYQASQNYRNPYFIFVATHQAQHCTSAPPHQNLHHRDLHHPNL